MPVELAKLSFWKNQKILEKEGKIINKPYKKGSSFFLPKDNLICSYKFNNSSITVKSLVVQLSGFS